MDYVTIHIHEPSCTEIDPATFQHQTKIVFTQNKTLPTFIDTNSTYATRLRIALHAPNINKCFSKNDYTDWLILHRRFDHLHDDKLTEMRKK